MSEIATSYDSERDETSVIATWYKRPYSGASYTAIKGHPSYYTLEDNGKDGLLAFRAVEKPSELCTECTFSESIDLEEKRIRRQELSRSTNRRSGDVQRIKDIFKKH